MDDSIAIARLVDALRPWLDHLVVVGGWAHQLHRLDSRANRQLSYAALRTRDADLAFSLTETFSGDMGAALKAAGFVEDFSTENTPPVSQYRLGSEDQGFYAEFLAPLLGGGVRRDGSPDVTVAKAGVTAQKLRYLELLLTEPWTVSVDKTVGVPVSSSARVMIANPVSFLAQKLLIQEQRRPEKRPQDVLYIHDTLDLFAGDLEGLGSLWRERIRPSLLEKTANQVVLNVQKQFSAVTDIHRRAARIPQDRKLSPEQLQKACAYGLEEIFGTP